MRALLISIVLLACLAPRASAAELDGATMKILKSMLTALEENDYDAFVADGDATFTAAMSKPQLGAVNKLIAPRMEKGYEIILLGELQQQGFRVCLAKLKFNDRGDDTLVKLSLKDGKVGGFWLQ
jgi:hypothetical protein